MTTTLNQAQPKNQGLALPWKSRFNAWFFDTFAGYVDITARPHKQRAFADLSPGPILEIGAGTGANFAYLPAGSVVLALEPNRAMHARLRRRADDSGNGLEIISSPAENIPLDDDSVETVICTLVLCTVTNPDAVLAEIRRVLRPGGTFRFVEHVAANPRSPRRWLQQALARPWAWLFEGCDLCRHTADSISSAGFSSVEIEERRLRLSIFIPVNSAIYGTATN